MLSKVHLEHIQDCTQLASYSNKISSPIAIDEDIFCVSENGDILKINSKGEFQVVFTILGHPSALAIREGEDSFLIADLAHQSIFSREQNSSLQIHNLICQYNDHAFLGPHSIKIGPFSKNMYLTDSGPFQETSLENKAGSLFLYRFDVQKLKCLSLRNLAYPTGLEIDEEEKYVLVCETGQNRILKFMIDDQFSGTNTVFHQFSGRIGPTSISGYNGKYYVSLFEFCDLSERGMIGVLGNQGELLEKFTIASGPQISGIWFLQEGNEEWLLVSEKCTIFKINLRKGSQEKLEESIVMAKN